MSETMIIPDSLIPVDDPRSAGRLVQEVPLETLQASQKFWEERVNRLGKLGKLDDMLSSPEEDILDKLDLAVYEDWYDENGDDLKFSIHSIQHTPAKAYTELDLALQKLPLPSAYRL